jgi:hypothetical protein
MDSRSGPLKYNESLITFVEPFSDFEYAIVGACGFVYLFTAYNGMKLMAATNALNNAPKSVKVSVAIYTYLNVASVIPFFIAMLQVGAPSYAAHVLAQSVYCVTLGVRTSVSVRSFVLWLIGSDREVWWPFIYM